MPHPWDGRRGGAEGRGVWRYCGNGKDNISIDDNGWDKDMDMDTKLHV